MKYSQPIIVEGWYKIAEKYSSWAQYGMTMHSKLVPKEDWNWLESIVCPALKKVTGLDHKINLCINFFVAPKKTRGIHLDYPNPRQPNWALNIPIINYEDSEMLWYSGDYSQYTYHRPGGMDSERITWNSEPTLIESYSIKEPTLVYVDVPHDVINHSSLPRVLMSIRTTPNILPVDNDK